MCVCVCVKCSVCGCHVSVCVKVSVCASETVRQRQ